MIRGVQQIALVQHNIPGAIVFYRDVLGLTLEFESPNLAFFHAGSVRLMLTPPSAPEFDHANSVIYFDVQDATAAYAEVVARGAHAERAPTIVGRTATHEIVIGFISDPEGNLLGLAEQRPMSAALNQ